jgi:hypothetical protein
MGAGGAKPGNLKVFKKKQLKKLGIDAEGFKREIVGPEGSHFNIAIDQEGNVFLVPVRTGAQEPVATGLNLSEIIPPQT